MSKTSAAPAKNLVIQASAGTGKTFQLTNRYLNLLFEGQEPEHILATTFTRKAAGEILQRVLLRLAAAATDDAKAKGLAAELGRADVVRPRCLELFHHLLRRLHRLRIGTLDSFFVQIAKSFALELGIPPGWSIIDDIDDGRLRREAVDDVLRGESTATLATLLNLLAKGETTRSIEQLVMGVVDGLDPLYCDTAKEAWYSLKRRKPLVGAEIAQLVDDLRGLSLNPQMAKSRDKEIQHIEAGEWEEIVGSGLTAKVLDGTCTYNRKPIPDEAIEVYRRVVEQCRAIVVEKLAMQTESSHALLEKFAEHYRRRKQERRWLRFDDITRYVAAPQASDAAEAVAFRLDAPLDHLLIDEFQDTSPPQWLALAPIAQRAARGDGGSFFCVGDQKQAIYAWRGGVAEIFGAVESQLPDVATESLAMSYRSSPPVIEAVNEVFSRLNVHPNLSHAEPAVRDWHKAFPKHSTARNKLPGHVTLSSSAEPEEGETANAAALKSAALQIAEETRRAPWASIGVLLRSNSAVARMIYELHALKVPASEEGGNPLTDSAAVQLLLSLLRLIDHPGHTIARYHVARSVLAGPLKFDDFQNDAAAADLTRRLRARLQIEGYGKLLDEWSLVLAESCDARELSRMMQLVELGFEWDEDATLRTDDFIAFVETQRVGDPSAVQVRVTTIHQSKGLEFDIVYLPQLTVRLVGQPGKFAARRPDPALPPDRVVRHVERAQQMLLPAEVQEMFAGMTHSAVTESLCMLYVAMTRAVYALHMIVPAVVKAEKTLPATFAGLLRATLAPDKPATANTILWETGRRDWMDAPGFEPKPAHPVREAPIPTRVVLAAAPKAGRRSLTSVAPSALAHVKVNVADLLASDARPALERGTLTHRWMEEIEWLDHASPTRDALLAASATGEWISIQPADYVAEFLDTLKRPGIAAMFRESEYRRGAASYFPPAIGEKIAAPEVALRVERERDFWIRDDEQMVTGSIDRLIVFELAGKPIAAEIIDFKTDRAAPGDQARLRELADRYRPQLSAYCRAVAEMLQLPAEQVIARLLVIQAGEAVPISGGPAMSSPKPQQRQLGF